MAGPGADSGKRLPALRPMLLVAALSWLPCVVVLMAAPLGAQTINGTLVEAGTGMPVEGASVTLLSRDNERLDWSLTNAAGRFNFRTPGPGTYLLQADRIGHARVLSDPIPIETGVNVAYRLEAPVEAIMLAGIEVGSSRRCEVRPGQGQATATVWEEARKALEATSLTTGLGRYRYMIRRFERELDARGRRVRSEQSRILRGQLLSTPFRAMDVENLLANGFVRPDGDGSIYYAPDADVLLSDPFLDTHCMRLAEGEDEAEGLLGLAFEPTEDRGVPDISGVLWVDPEDARLRWMDYRYEFLDVPDSERLGGKIRFYGLPDGTWIVREWSIRMPLLAAGIDPIRGRLPPRLVGIKEDGGLVVRVSNRRGDPILDSGTGTIDGVVVDAEGSEPVEEVIVLLDDSTRITTDGEGRFRLSDLVGGYYSLRVLDPALDSLGLSPEPVLVEVSPGEVASARLRFQSSDAVLTEVCGPVDLSENEGILAGFARFDTGEPAPGVQISVRWQEVIERFGGIQGVDHSLTTTELRDDGFFLLCGVAQGLAVQIVSEWNGVESRPERFVLSRTQRLSRRDITIRPNR